MKNNRNILLALIFIVIFGGVGFYLTFFSSNTRNYDRQTKAYKIELNEEYDSEAGTVYRPTYYYKVEGKEYECKAKIATSFEPDRNKNKVYYDSTNPNKCLTEYEKSSNKIFGIIFLVVSAVFSFLTLIKRPPEESEQYNQQINKALNQQNVEKVVEAAEKISLIYKRVILGIIISILIVMILFDTIFVKQTIISRNYEETTAEFIGYSVKEGYDPNPNAIYKFRDKKGNEYSVNIISSDNEEEKKEIKVKYNKEDPNDYYVESSLMDKKDIILYVVKIVICILLIILFFNKKLLSKVNLSASKSK